jgi:hypothetical protein
MWIDRRTTATILYGRLLRARQRDEELVGLSSRFAPGVADVGGTPPEDKSSKFSEMTADTLSAVVQNPPPARGEAPKPEIRIAANVRDRGEARRLRLVSPVDQVVSHAMCVARAATS